MTLQTNASRRPPGRRARRPGRSLLRRLHRTTSGAMATEHVLTLVLVVIPIALMMPMIQRADLRRRVEYRIRRNEVALRWLVNDYVGRGGGSGAGGPVATWIADEVRPRLQDILRTLDDE